ncbi:MAG: hypothetical protein GXO99_09040 [Nitrospirae bacterium]|nr:hypothetical protein [Nitrospirota bacterium]
MSYISALAMLFRLLLALCFLAVQPGITKAKIVDRVVAYVGYDAITYVDLTEFIEKMHKKGIDIKPREAVKTLVNRLIFIKEARRLRLQASNNDALIQKYIDIKIKPFVFIKDEEVLAYYKEHIDVFKDRPFEQLREEITRVLFEKKLNRAIKEHLKKLKRSYDVVIIKDALN